MNTRSLLIGVLMLSLVGIVGVNAQVSVELTIENQQVVGTDFFFDIVLTRLGTNDAYLGTADFVLTFNVGNFTNPVLSKSTNVYSLVSTNSVPVGAMYRTATSAAAISGNELILNLQQVLFGDQGEFEDNIARINNAASTHRMGRFRITNITNPGGTVGLHWKTSGTGVTTKVFTLATSDPWASTPTSVQATDPSETPLPITLASFTGHSVSNGVRLDWTTLTEVNNYGFEVQKSQVQSGGYQTIPNSFIPGHGTTIEPHTYTYTDITASTGAWYYRLKQMDLDQTVHYSEPILIQVLTDVKEVAPLVFALNQNYPNPFNPQSEIKFSVETTGRTTLQVYNIAGQLVATLFDGVAEAGQYYRVQFGGSGMASGVYFYRLQSKDKSDLKKMLLLK